MLKEIPLLRISRIIGDAGFGASFPIIVLAEDGKEYILKTKEDDMQMNSLSIFNEVVAYKIIEYLGITISPQEIVYLYIDDSFLEMAKIAFNEKNIKKESLENIEASFGVNVGIEYLHNTMEPQGKIENKSFLKDLAHIDNYIMNCDRASNNINILQDTRKHKVYYAIDFGNALSDGINGELFPKIINDEINELILGKASNCNITLSGAYSLKNDVQSIVKKPQKLKDDYTRIRLILTQIINEFPDEWEVLKYKDVVIDILARRMKSMKIFNLDEKCDCII